MAPAVDGWSFILLFAYISVALLLAVFLRRQLPFLQQLSIPNAFIAGLIVLLCSQLLKVMQISLEHLSTIAYHLLTGIFILIGLSGARRKQKRAVFTTTLMVGKGYALLAVFGCLFTLVWVKWLLPNFPPSFSMLPLLGFGFDHLTAQGMGLQWEQVGFGGGGYAGFSFGVMGLFWAYLGGTILILWARKRRGKDSRPTPVLNSEGTAENTTLKSEKPAGGHLTTAPLGLSPLALNLALIGALYLLTFSCMNQFAAWLGRYGGIGEFFGGILWSYNYLGGLLLGYLARVIIDWLNLGAVFDRGMMRTITATMTDYMIVASLAAVPLLIYANYWVEVVLLSLICGLAMAFFVYFAAHKMYTRHRLARMAAVFGYLTGTIASGVALLRMADPEFDSPAVEDLAWAGGLSLLIGFPLLIFIYYPLYGPVTGMPLRYLLITLALFAGYGLLLFLAWFLWSRSSAYKKKVHLNSTSEKEP